MMAAPWASVMVQWVELKCTGSRSSIPVPSTTLDMPLLRSFLVSLGHTLEMDPGTIGKLV